MTQRSSTGRGASPFHSRTAAARLPVFGTSLRYREPKLTKDPLDTFVEDAGLLLSFRCDAGNVSNSVHPNWTVPCELRRRPCEHIKCMYRYPARQPIIGTLSGKRAGTGTRELYRTATNNINSGIQQRSWAVAERQAASLPATPSGCVSYVHTHLTYAAVQHCHVVVQRVVAHDGLAGVQSVNKYE